MKLFKQFFILIISCWIMILSCPPFLTTLIVNAQSELDFEQSVDDDLKTFKFDYPRN